MSEHLIDPTLLFEFEIPILKLKPSISTASKLTAAYEIPSLSELSDRQSFASIRMGWSVKQLSVRIEIRGKKRAPIFSGENGGRSDGARFWIDTRSSPGIHRASKFCHCFSLIPPSASRKTAWLSLEEIPRSIDRPDRVAPNLLEADGELLKDGYIVCANIPSAALTGYDPLEFPQLGFFYSISDAEFGVQTLSVSSQLRYMEDPSLWSRIRLT